MKKITLTIFLSFVIALTIFIYLQNIFDDTQFVREKEFFSRNFDETNSKILLLGSSHVGMLNAKNIESTINENHSKYIVFNLARAGDTPEKRIQQATELLKLNPSVVVYGIGYRDFSTDIVLNNENIFPEPDKTFVDILEKFDFLPDNPKFTTLNAIRSAFGIGIINSSSNLPDTPFFPYDSSYDTVTPINELEKQFISEKNQIKIQNLNLNHNVHSLKKLLDQFEDKNIKIIIFVTPHSLHYLNNLSDSDKQEFENIVNELKLNHNISLNNLLLNYSKSEIWVSTNHITHGDIGRIYDEDISKMILKEIEQ